LIFLLSRYRSSRMNPCSSTSTDSCLDVESRTVAADPPPLVLLGVRVLRGIRLSTRWYY
jgi:hypothetical protein